MSKPLVEGIYFVEIPAKDLDESIHWYTHLLDFRLNDKPSDALAFLEPVSGGPNILLWKVTEDTTINFHKEGKVHHTLGFVTERIDELFQVLARANVRVTEVQDEGPAGKFLYFYDPTGNYLYAHEYPNTAEW